MCLFAVGFLLWYIYESIFVSLMSRSLCWTHKWIWTCSLFSLSTWNSPHSDSHSSPVFQSGGCKVLGLTPAAGQTNEEKVNVVIFHYFFNPNFFFLPANYLNWRAKKSINLTNFLIFQKLISTLPNVIMILFYTMTMQSHELSLGGKQVISRLINLAVVRFEYSTQ